MATQPSSSPYFSQMLDRVMRILDCFNADEAELRLGELVDRTGLHKSTVYRLLGAMREYGLVGVDEDSGKFHLGLKFFELGTLAIRRLRIEEHAHPILERLVEQTGETAHLCVLDGSDVVYVAKVESFHALRIPSAVGLRNPAYCTGVGKALLAYLTEERLAAYLARTSLRAFTKKTIRSKADLRAELAAIALRGYAIDDGEREEGVRCVGAAVRDYSGRVVAAISIAGPATRVTRERVAELARHVIGAAQAISAKAGYAPSKDAAPGTRAASNRTASGL
jgi:IclR family transcriptional regulator, KDG regulon repressor